MQRYSDSVILAGKGSLQAMAGARVYVYHAGTSTLATIYSDNGSTEQSNPLTAGSDGEYSFFAADGLYDIQAIVGALSDVKRGVQLWGAGVSGAVGDGVTDDTTAIQAAFTAGGVVVLPAGTFMVTTLTVATSVRLLGAGTIKQIASTAADMITVSGTSTKFEAHGITFDGNEANQTALTNYASIKHTAVGTASDPAVLEIVGCTFRNGRWADITVLNDAQRSTIDKVIIRGNKFLGGREGTTSGYAPRYIDIRSCVDYIVADNVLDFCGTPAAFGRAGILAYDGHDTTFYPSRGVISGNHLNAIGRSQATTTLGAIDLYDTGRSTSITGNTLVNSYGRGIQCKADSECLAISGNVVDGLSGGSDGTMNAQITINASTRTAYEGSVVISGNACVDSGRDGISVTTSNSDDTGYAGGILISANTVRNATRRGIGCVDSDDISIIGNSVEGCETGIYIQTVVGEVIVANNKVRGTSAVGIQITDDCDTASVRVSGNTVTDTGGRGIYVASGARGHISGNTVNDNAASYGIEVAGTSGRFVVEGNHGNSTDPFGNGGSNTALYVGRNEWETPLTFTGRTVTISTGAITVTQDIHWVDTEGAAASDDLTTINGGHDGQILTLRAADAARTVVVKDGSTLRLAGDFTMDNSQDSITLRYYAVDSGGTWVEMARSDNGA